MSDGLDVTEFIAGYLAEAEEHLSLANSNLLAVEASLKKKENNPRAVRELFRSLHTLKGLSAMVSAEPIVEISHEMETLLRTADRAGGVLSAAAVDLLLRGVRAIEARVDALGRHLPVEPAPVELVEAIAALQVNDGAARARQEVLELEPELLEKLSTGEQQQLLLGIAEGRRAVRADFVPSPQRAAEGLTITTVRQKTGALGELVKVLPRMLPAADGQSGGLAFALLLLTSATDAEIALATGCRPEDLRLLGARPPDETPAPLEEEAFFDRPESAKGNVLRVDVERLDDALDRLAALIVSRAKLQRAIAALSLSKRDERTLNAIVAENARQLRDLRSAIMRARMVRVAELLERAPLIVRGLCKTSKKQVALTVDAGRAELDKSVADRLFPAVVHLTRNAIDHGIDSPGERRANGKPEEGTLRISCIERGGNQLELTITDDGQGISAQKVAARAGSPVPENDAQLLELITRPGLSTLDKATQTSGRGYGMDIVKRIAVDDLGGDLQLITTPGSGTTFTLRVPLSVTIIDAFTFMCGDELFVVPVSSVEDLADLDTAQIVRAPSSKVDGSAAQLLQHRGVAMPLFHLGSLLGVSAVTAERPKAIIVRLNAEPFALQVERMVGQQEIVVRPVKDPLIDVEGISGSTDLGDGRPTLVLDLPGVLRRSLGRKEARA